MHVALQKKLDSLWERKLNGKLFCEVGVEGGVPRGVVEWTERNRDQLLLTGKSKGA